jgi:hypothetical protein
VVADLADAGHLHAERLVRPLGRAGASITP